MPDAILCIPEITSPFSACFLSPGFAGLPGKHSGILCVRTGKCCASTTDAKEGTEDIWKQRGKCWRSAAEFHPTCENMTMQATNTTDLLTAAGKLSHPAAVTAVGTNLESECCARITQD